MKKVMIDVGHGGTDPGAAANGLIEKTLNLKVALKIKAYLAGYDAEVKLSRETDISLDADARASLIQQYNPTLCVSVHHNAANGSARGSEVIHAAVNKKDDLLANDILYKLEKAGMPIRRAFTKLNDNGQDWYFMIRRIIDADTDAIIVEGGFVDNIEDAKLLKDEKFLDAEAKAIAEGIINYLGLKQQLTLIMGQAIACVEQMTAYARKINPNPKLSSCTLEELAQIFLEEGTSEGVRGDVAWAQAVKETGAFGYGGIVLPEQNNYSGIGALNNNKQGQAAVFETPRLGARAQMQHLKAYASSAALKNACIDPRFNLVMRASAPYVEWLGFKDNPNGTGWAYPGAGYGYDIIKRLNIILVEPVKQKTVMDKLKEQGLITKDYKLDDILTCGEFAEVVVKLLERIDK